ncbi:MAG: hypothetical protein QXQ24_05580 [Nitrososphaeria archaeon]
MEAEKVRVSFRLRKEQYNKLLELAKRDGCLTVSEYVRKIVNEKLQEFP